MFSTFSKLEYLVAWIVFPFFSLRHRHRVERTSMPKRFFRSLMGTVVSWWRANVLWLDSSFSLVGLVTLELREGSACGSALCGVNGSAARAVGWERVRRFLMREGGFSA